MPQPTSRRRFIQDATVVAAAATSSASAEAGAVPMADPSEPNVYTRIGVRPVINGVGTVTVLGGSVMPPEVIQAMEDASKFFVSLPELQTKVGARLAELIGVPAAMVTSGAASAITVATAACITRGDGQMLSRLPDSSLARNEVILQSSHRSSYEAQILVTGARLVWVESREELHRAISDRTAMMFFLNKADPDGQIHGDEWVRIGKERGVPTFNDAAADVPPASRLSSYIRDGFDLVAFSGGKGMLGPQSTGLLLGRADLIAAGRHAISPAMGIGRGMKVGKEEMIGLLAAVERFLKTDHEAERRLLEHRVSDMIAALSPVAGLRARRDLPEVANHVPHVVLDWDAGGGRPTAREIIQRLIEGDPPIAVAPEGERGLRISVWMMQGNEHQVVASRLREVFATK